MRTWSAAWGCCLAVLITTSPARAQAFLRARQFGEPGSVQTIARSVAVDAAGNVYISGYFGGMTDFDPGPGTHNLIASGGQEAFISKLSASAAVTAGDVGNTLAVQKTAGGDLSLSWGSSCTTTDDDYGVYEGEIGFWYSHEAFLCSTGGLISVTPAPEPFDTYYLIVPHNEFYEGFYGRDFSGTPLPQGGFTCAVQQAAPCP